MNQVLEVIIAIFLMVIIIYPFLYLYNISESNSENIVLFNKFYNLINSNESLRSCLIKESCNLSWVQSYNCSSKKTLKLPSNYLSFYLIGDKDYYCPTLVIIDLSKAKNKINN